MLVMFTSCEDESSDVIPTFDYESIFTNVFVMDTDGDYQGYNTVKLSNDKLIIIVDSKSELNENVYADYEYSVSIDYADGGTVIGTISGSGDTGSFVYKHQVSFEFGHFGC